MVCPRCRRAAPAKAGRCAGCGAALAEGGVAAATIAIDTTGLPPGATFGPTFNSPTLSAAPPTGGGTGAFATMAATGAFDSDASAARMAGGPLAVGQAF